MLALTACGTGASERTGADVFTLGVDQSAILGFERPTTDWSAPTGGLASSGLVTQGTAALSVQPTGWTEITSVPLSSLGQVQSTFKLDVRVPAAAGWGEARVILVAPSRGLHWAELGSQPLAGLPVGQFATLSFPISVAVKTALEGSYADLRIKIVLNGPSFSAPYVFDNIVLTPSNGGGGGGGGGSTSGGSASGGSSAGASSGGASSGGVAGSGAAGSGTVGSSTEISAVIPLGQTRANMLLSAADYLQVDDRVEIGVQGQLLQVAGLGTTGVQVGSALKGHNNTFSGGNVVLRSQSVVDGFVRAQGTVDKQDGTVRVLGAEQPHVDVPPRRVRWKAAFPDNATPLGVVQQASDLFLDPGSYLDLDVHGGRVHLRTGTYFLRKFNTEPNSRVFIDNDDGPVFVYVKDAFTFKGPFVEDVEHEGQVLVGYLGTSVALLQAPFVGTLVAPNAKVELRRPDGGQHKGSWFAKELQVFSDSQILGLPFDWTKLPPDDEPLDTDGDGVIDPLDGCVFDPNKVEPLDCGCNEPETDDDDDDTPNCIDACPTDPDNVQNLSCGCRNEITLQPQGKRCIVEACSGSKQEATCDGAGHCGDPSCDPLPSGCFWRVHDDSLYWFCDADVSWQVAAAACGQQPKRYLAKVDSGAENRWLQRVSGGNAWLGGSDLAQTDSWRWSNPLGPNGALFWLGGLPVPARFTKWAADRPSGGDCLAMGSDGLWSDEACGTQRGFICEQPLLHLPFVPEGPSIDDFYPQPEGDGGGDDDEGEPDDGTEDCVENDEEFGTDQAAALALGERCRTECPTEDADTCNPAEDCTGFATPPVPGALACRPFSGRAKASCELATVHPTATCTIANPTCPDGFVCGHKTECASLDANFQAKPCSEDEPCSAPEYCGTRVKVCIDPFRTSTCSDKIPGTEQCVGQCFGVLACGTVDPDCAAKDDDIFTNCSRTRLCPEPGSVVVDLTPLSGSNLTEQTFPADTFFPEPQAVVSPFPDAKPANCGGDNEPDCAFDLGQHPWCTYTVDQAQTPESRSVSDADAPFGDKRGTSGSSGPISFDFDPNLILTYDIDQPLPLGDSKFRAYAEASASAAAHFQLFGIKGDVNILDALGSAEVDRCGLETNARLKLFGHDFLPAILGDNYEHLDDLDTPEDIRGTCLDAIEAFQLVVGRAQKALRDAQELIRQQKSLVAAGKRFSPTLCEELLELSGVPANFPTPDAPFVNCNDLSPEDTINFFIRYYQSQIAELIKSQAAMLLPASKPGGSLPEFPEFEISFLNVGSQNGGDTIDDDSRRETQEIANIQFAIGPVPVNLTVDAFVEYGIEGSLKFGFNPMGLLDVYKNDGRPLNEKTQQLAYADASITPFAGAGASMFVGVGFDFGGLSAKFGIAGDVTLGNVSLPLYARAGIKVTPEQDSRGLPSDFGGMLESAEMMFPVGPPLKYRYDAFYKFGANATIKDILKGKISAKLKLSFFWFSKTWTKTVASFDSPFDPIDIELISGGDGLPFAESSGKLGAVGQPVPFVKLALLETPEPLPPLPPDGSGGSGGTGAGGGAGTGGNASGARPPVSLLVAGDPRYVGFDAGRAGKLFYDGYCECSGLDAPCTSNLGCCDGTKCVKDDNLTPPSGGKCLACISPPSMYFSGVCGDTEDCCKSGDPQKPNICSPTNPAQLSRKYCRQCSGDGDPFWDLNGDNLPDYDECCPGTRPFISPTPGVSPKCIICQPPEAECNETADCCPVPGRTRFCNSNHKCDSRSDVPT